MIEFRWNAWNLDHATQHGVTPEEAESVVRGARRPYPRREAEGKWLVQGRGVGGRMVQVFYVIGDDRLAYIIHAMPLTTQRRRGGGRR